MRYGFIGCGNMGGAVARAVCRGVGPENVVLANRTPAKAEALAEALGCRAATNDVVAQDCDVIFLGVKPQMMADMLAGIAPILAKRSGRFVLVTMAAGLSMARVREMAGGAYPIIRIMPNTPVSLGAGMIQYCADGVSDDQMFAFLGAIAPAGRLDAIPENLIDAACCVSGIGRRRRCCRITPRQSPGICRPDPFGQRPHGAGKRQPPRRTERCCVQPRRFHHSGCARAGRARVPRRSDRCRPGRL